LAHAGVVRWRLKDLALWVWEEFRVSVSETTLSRILRADKGIDRDRIEVWFADEARIGQPALGTTGDAAFGTARAVAKT